jgi:hypothetical protein
VQSMGATGGYAQWIHREAVKRPSGIKQQTSRVYVSRAVS